MRAESAPAMPFKTVATALANQLLIVFALGSFFLMLPPRQPSACESDFHARVFRTHHYLVLAVLVAAPLLLLAQTEVGSAEAAAGARARREGVVAIAARWHRVWLRALLLLAVLLSFAASLLAFVTYKDGFWLWTGCDARHAGFGAGSPVAVVIIAVLALSHGVSAWTAVCQN